MRVPAAAVVLSLAPALGLCQSLGDAARRQADKRSGRPPATARSYTDADLGPEQSEAVAGEARDGPEARPPTPDGGLAGAPPPRAGDPAADDPVRARLDREAEQRKQQELRWRLRALQARARVDAAKREHDAVCGPGVLLLTGG
jgi:hypothetical protein